MERKENNVKNNTRQFVLDKDEIRIYREFSVNSESVAKDLIDKIISLTITKANTNDMNSRIPDKCWEFTQKILNEFVKLEYLALDRDDCNLGVDNSMNREYKKTTPHDSSQLIDHNFKSKFSIINNKFENLVNKEFHSFNTSEENEEKNMTKDFIEQNDEKINLNLVAKNSSIITDNFGPIFFDNKYQGINNWSFIEQPVSAKIDRAASTVIKVVKNPNVNSNEIPIIINSTKQTIEQEKENININESVLNISQSRPNIKDNKLSQAKVSMSGLTFPIIKKKHNPYDFPNFPLNKEILQDYQEDDSDIEELRKVKKEEWKKKEEESKVKQKVEKDLKEKESEIFKKHKEYERKNVTADANGNIIFIKATTVEKLCNDFINPKSEVKLKGEIINQINVTKSERGEMSIKEKRDKERERERELMMSEKKKENTKDIKQIGVSNKKLEFNTNNTSGFIQPALNTSYERFEKGSSITPAGSSFNYIMPEIGVTVIEGGQSKHGGGGKDYFKAFKKYSKYDYQTMLKDSNVMSSMASSIKDFTLENHNLKNESIYKERRTSLLPSIIENPKGENRSTYNQSSQFKTKLGGSLKEALDGLDEVIEYDENPSLDNNENIFKKTKKDDLDQENYYGSLEEINKFNLSIVKNTQWGLATAKGTVGRHDSTHFKPDLREIEKEVGKNIAKTKLPRSRNYTYVKTPAVMMNSTTMNKTTKGFVKGKENKSTFNQTVGGDKKFSQTQGDHMLKKIELNPLRK